MQKKNELGPYKKKAVKGAVISDKKDSKLNIARFEFWNINISFYYFFFVIEVYFSYIIEIKIKGLNITWNNLIVQYIQINCNR